MTAQNNTAQPKQSSPKPRKPEVELFDPFDLIFKVKPRLDPFERYPERKCRMVVR